MARDEEKKWHVVFIAPGNKYGFLKDSSGTKIYFVPPKRKPKQRIRVGDCIIFTLESGEKGVTAKYIKTYLRRDAAKSLSDSYSGYAQRSPGRVTFRTGGGI